MKANPLKVTVHMVSSLDGFVVKNDGDVSWLQTHDAYEDGIVLSEEMIKAVLSSIDCYIMGSKTYEHALKLGWPYGEKEVFVMTGRTMESSRANVKFYHGNISSLLDLLEERHKNVWLVGGPQLVKSFLLEERVDEIVISIVPVVIGEGKLFFDFVGREVRLHLKDNKAYSDGMVELTYEILK